jgi:hypothetical protein
MRWLVQQLKASSLCKRAKNVEAMRCLVHSSAFDAVRGVVNWHRGQSEDAIREYDKALAIQPDLKWAHNLSRTLNMSY